MVRTEEQRLLYNRRATEYKKTYNGKKSHKVSEWKRKTKIKETDERFEEIFNKWWHSKNCEICNCEYTKSNFKCADHDHLSGHFRNVICNKCNKDRRSYDVIRLKLNLEIHRYHNLNLP
jgi:hypothetical protein